MQLSETAKLYTGEQGFTEGEIKSDEVRYLLNASMTGHKCLCSVHASDPKSAIERLANYVRYQPPRT